MSKSTKTRKGLFYLILQENPDSSGDELKKKKHSLLGVEPRSLGGENVIWSFFYSKYQDV